MLFYVGGDRPKSRAVFRSSCFPFSCKMHLRQRVQTSHTMLQNVRRSLALVCIAVESTRLPCSALGFVVTSLAPPRSKSKARWVSHFFCQQKYAKEEKCQKHCKLEYPVADRTLLLDARRSSAPLRHRRRYTDTWGSSRFHSLASLSRPPGSICIVVVASLRSCTVAACMSFSRPSLLATFNLMCWNLGILNV